MMNGTNTHLQSLIAATINDNRDALRSIYNQALVEMGENAAELEEEMPFEVFVEETELSVYGHLVE